MSTNSTLFLVDGSSLAFRSFYALITSGMRNGEGMPTWAVYGFFSAIFDLIDRYSPHSLAVCFDMAEPTFRHQDFEDYKANRQEMPDDLSVQWPHIKRGVKVLSIPCYELAGYEADDIIGTVAVKAKERGLDVVILTGDQDSFQLLQYDWIKVLMPTREGMKVYQRQEVFEKLGIWPEQVIDYKALCGDSSDNIPGVKGIGPKTAQKLLSQFQTLDNVYANLDSIKSASEKKKLTEGHQSAYSSQSLATILLETPLDFDFDHCRLSPPEPDTVVDFFQEMNFKAFLKRLPKILAGFNEGVEPEIDKSNLKGTDTKAKAQSANEDSDSVGRRPAVQLSLLERPDTADSAETSTSFGGSQFGNQIETRIVKSRAAFDEVLEKLRNADSFALDLKIQGNHASPDLIGIGLAWGAPCRLSELGRLAISEKSGSLETAYIPCGEPGEVPITTGDVLAGLGPLLADGTKAKMSYDCKQLYKLCILNGIDLDGVAFDPLLASYIADPNGNHKLASQAEKFLGRTLSDLSLVTGSGKRAIPLDMLPTSQLGPSSAEAALAVLELAQHYLQQLDEDRAELLWGMDLPLSKALARVELNGVAIDRDYFKSLEKELQEELARLEKEIHTLAGHGFNIGSPLQLQKVLFEELKLPPKGRTKSGFSTDASVLEELADEHEIIGKILEYRQVSKLVSTYVESLPRQVGKDGRLHGEFNQASTATGRLSSTNPNLQNIPIRSELGRRIRRGFVSSIPDGHIVSADYSQIELRFLAHMSGDENLIAAFQSGQDIHSRTAMLVFDVPLDAVTTDMRAVGKTLNFALIYQQGAFATGKALGITTKEAQAFTEKYFKSFPRVRSFMSRIIDEARETGFVQTLWGRRRYFQHLNDRNDSIRKADERAAFNAPLQGSAADLMRLAMIRLANELESRKMKSRLILQVHDELVLEVPPDELDEAREVLASAMGMDQPLSVPLQVDVGTGKNWMDAK